MQFSLHHSFPSDANFAGAWNQLLAESITDIPFLRHEYLSTWWSTRGGGEWPASAELALVIAEEDGQLVGIAPLFFSENRDKEPSLLLIGSIEISDYLDLIVRPAHLSPFVHGLMDFLSAMPLSWKCLDWHNLFESSPTLPLLQSEVQKLGWFCTIEKTYHAPSIPLPGDFETYLCGIDKKQRHEIRRKMRRAAEMGGVDWYIVTDEPALDGEIDSLFNLMSTDPAKAAFLTDSMRTQMRASLWAAFKAGWLQLAFLTINGMKAVMYVNFDYQDRIWVYNSGFDPRFTDYSPGWVLLGFLLEWANENHRREFDFMRGDEHYKYRFGGVDKLLVRAKITR
jgi:CelD/BcsL family acetyltransferase involved in cellulose biosynthesis